MRDGRFDRNGVPPPRIGGKGKGTIGKGKRDASMCYIKSIGHFLTNRHFEFGISFSFFNAFDSEPLTKIVFDHHGIYYFGGCGHKPCVCVFGYLCVCESIGTQTHKHANALIKSFTFACHTAQ